MRFAMTAARALFALVFLAGAVVPPIAAIAAPQAASQAFQNDCHRRAIPVAALADTANPQNRLASQPSPTRPDQKFFGPCVCVLCLSPVSPHFFGDAVPIVIPPARAAARLSFATGVSATFGPRKATNFATGPPAAVRLA